MGGGRKQDAVGAGEAEAEERLRRKKLGFSRNILSKTAVKVESSAALGPSKTVMKHHGRDILRKSQRKNKYLFSFPGLLAPISGGKIGELKDLATKNPILYLDFPQGQMKLFGTIVYPKNRYLTLQFSKGGKNVTCDDYFENMIVFSDAWWIGTKEENPEELRLEFPKELNEKKHAECDFKGGAGGMLNSKQVSGRSVLKSAEQESTNVNLEDDLSERSNDYTELVESTPTKRPARTVGKILKYAESSGDDLIENVDDTPEEEDEGNDIVGQQQHKQTGKAKEPFDNKHTPLVQTTLSSLFKKVEEKVKKDAKKITDTPEALKAIKGRKKTEGKRSGMAAKNQKKQRKFEEDDDDIVEFSSASEGASDEDWNV